MKNKIIFLIFISILSLLGCQHQETTNTKLEAENAVFIDIDHPSEVSFRDYFSNIEIIPLETNENSLIARQGKTLYHDNKFFVLDKSQNALFIFTDKGKFIKKIQRVGRGPGEYSLVYDFNINPYTNNLEFLNPRGAILVYNLDGEFISEISLPNDNSAYHNFINVSPDTVLFYTASNEKLFSLYARSKDEILRQFYDALHHNFPIKTQNTPLYKSNGNIYFTDAAQNHFYKYENDSLISQYTWDFGKYNFNHYEELPLDQDVLSLINYFKNIENNKDNAAYNFQARLVTSNYVFTSFFFVQDGEQKFGNIIYNTQTDQAEFFEQFKEGGNFYSANICAGGIYDVIPPQVITNQDLGIIGPSLEILSETDKEKWSKITLNDNPVIVRYTFKEDRVSKN